MSSSALRSHDISNRTWELLAAHLPGQTEDWGGVAKDNCLFINAGFWILRTGAPWRNLPPRVRGLHKDTHKRFSGWREKRIWKKLLDQLVTNIDYEWLMIDAGHHRVHPHAAGAHGGNQYMQRKKRAQYKAALGCGGAWYANPSTCHVRYLCRLYASWQAYPRDDCAESIGGQGL